MEQRVRLNESPVRTRYVPIDHLRITATASGSAQTLHTVRAGVMLKIGRLSVANTTGSAATLTLHSIPSGGSIGADNTELAALSIAANTAVNLTELIGGLYQTGTAIKAYSGTNGALILHGWGEEIL